MFLIRSTRCMGIAGFAALAAACASQTATPVADADKQVCVREAAIGSIRPTMTCRTVAQIEREREEAQKNMNAARQDTGGAPADRIGR